jgi:DNA-directed RNA polymerase specialized sigma24 family protein
MPAVKAAGSPRRPRGHAAEALAELFRDHHLELVRLALVMVGDLATAEDIVQDAFERLHRGWRRLRQPSSGPDAVSAAADRGEMVAALRSLPRER